MGPARAPKSSEHSPPPSPGQLANRLLQFFLSEDGTLLCTKDLVSALDPLWGQAQVPQLRTAILCPGLFALVAVLSCSDCSRFGTRCQHLSWQELHAGCAPRAWACPGTTRRRT
eukprot:1495452-Amphidinium_carterae.1